MLYVHSLRFDGKAEDNPVPKVKAKPKGNPKAKTAGKRPSPDHDEDEKPLKKPKK